MYALAREHWNFWMHDHFEYGGRIWIFIPILAACVATLLLNEWRDRYGSDLYQRDKDVRNTILKQAKEKQDAHFRA